MRDEVNKCRNCNRAIDDCRCFDNQLRQDKELREKILEAIEDEYYEHRTCDYEMGCVLSSEPLRKKIDKLLSSYRQEVKREVENVCHEITDEFGEGEATDIALIFKDKLLKQL